MCEAPRAGRALATMASRVMMISQQAGAGGSELVDELLVEGQGEALGGEEISDGNAQWQRNDPADQS